jgi:hypothetical protein
MARAKGEIMRAGCRSAAFAPKGARRPNASPTGADAARKATPIGAFMPVAEG